MDKAKIAQMFKDEVDRKSFFVIPSKLHEQMGVTKTVIKNAITSIVAEGYKLYYFLEDPKVNTSVRKVLAPAGTTYASLVKRRDELFD